MDVYKLLGDKYWRMNNLYKIVDAVGDIVLFKFNDVQELIWRDMSNGDNKRDIILKARQFGVTTFWLIYALDEVLFNKGFTAEFISIGKDEMEKSFKKIKLAWDHLDPAIKKLFALGRESLSMMEFGHNSSISVGLSSRGGTVSFLHISELGKIASKFPLKAEEIKTGSLPAAIKGRIVIESTAEGASGMFYQFWNKSNSSRTFFKPHFYPWFFDKSYSLPNAEIVITDKERELTTKIQKRFNISISNEQLAWYRQQRETYNDKVVQEYPSFPEEAFLTSGRPVFESQYLVVSGEEKEPIDDHEYMVSIDPADSGADFSVIKCIDRHTMEVVFNYERDVPLEQLALDATRVGLEYNTAMIIFERNGVGIALRPLLMNYPNVYTTTKKLKAFDELTQIVGFYTTKATKQLIISNLAMLLREGKLTLSDPMDVEQLKVFQHKDGGKMEAPEGYHDDRVMALALGVTACLEYPVMPLPDYEKQKQSIIVHKQTEWLQKARSSSQKKENNVHW